MYQGGVCGHICLEAERRDDPTARNQTQHLLEKWMISLPLLSALIKYK